MVEIMAKGHITSSQMGFGVSGVGASGALIVGLVGKGTHLKTNGLFIASVVVFIAGLLWLGATGAHAAYVWLMAKQKKKGGRYTPPNNQPATRRATSSQPAPPGSGIVIRDSDDIRIEGLTYIGPGNAVDAANSTNVTAKNIQHFSTGRDKPRAKDEKKTRED